MLAAYVHTPISVIPNGVDLEYFEPTRPSGRAYIPNRIVFTGNMSYRPNVDAVQHLVTAVLPRIRQEIPDVQLWIVGMDPSPAVRRLADGDRVVVTGRVDDVRPYFDSAAVAVAPLRVARGLQNKVLEAMAMRVPVVASPAAFAGISAVAGRDLLVAGWSRRRSAAPLSPCSAIPPPASAMPRPAAPASKRTTTGAGSCSGSKIWWSAATTPRPPSPGQHHRQEELTDGT